MHNPHAIYSDTRPLSADDAVPFARRINQLARAHRASWTSTPAAQIRTGVALFVCIARAGALRRLNAMGELLDARGISNEVSERTLDSPFESGEITEKTVAKITRLIVKDQALRVSLCRQGWRDTVHRWLTEAAKKPSLAGQRAQQALEAMD